eukprot:TRINITY_DN73060_c0_g1_i1.p1 TRINITY_DN73060_c0_g1~~TRINITY_DN73060_c0_g1_i1.p1  ORF type:complete len:666 (-),score=155.95 TRINITY_DN73060_c0_g1_i1:106-2049(-)
MAEADQEPAAARTLPASSGNAGVLAPKEPRGAKSPRAALGSDEVAKAKVRGCRAVGWAAAAFTRPLEVRGGDGDRKNCKGAFSAIAYEASQSLADAVDAALEERYQSACLWEICRPLLERGAQVGRTSTGAAEQRRTISAAARVLQSGASADAWKGPSKPLIAAVAAGNLDLVRLLLRFEADPDVVDESGRSSLHHAAKDGYVGICRCLRLAGADANIRDAKSWPPLFFAKRAGICTELFQASADLRAVSARDGSSALHVAARTGNTEVLSWLTARVDRAFLDLLDARGCTAEMWKVSKERRTTWRKRKTQDGASSPSVASSYSPTHRTHFGFQHVAGSDAAVTPASSTEKGADEAAANGMPVEATCGAPAKDAVVASVVAVPEAAQTAVEAENGHVSAGAGTCADKEAITATGADAAVSEIAGANVVAEQGVETSTPQIADTPAPAAEAAATSDAKAAASGNNADASAVSIGTPSPSDGIAAVAGSSPIEDAKAVANGTDAATARPNEEVSSELNCTPVQGAELPQPPSEETHGSKRNSVGSAAPKGSTVAAEDSAERLVSTQQGAGAAVKTALYVPGSKSSVTPSPGIVDQGEHDARVPDAHQKTTGSTVGNSNAVPEAAAAVGATDEVKASDADAAASSEEETY